MSMNESVAYLKGLAEGLDIDATTKEGKLFTAIISVLEEISDTVSEAEEKIEELDELVDIIDEDLGSIEEDFYGEDDDDECDCEDSLYEVVCDKCGNVVYLDEDTILSGSIDCPECGELLEFDLDECDCGEHECDCGCGCDKE